MTGKLPDIDGMYRRMAEDPKLARRQVWCRRCGSTQKVDSAECLRSGWPKCCGHTMTIDGPEERRA
jgi:hypothetical protein